MRQDCFWTCWRAWTASGRDGCAHRFKNCLIPVSERRMRCSIMGKKEFLSMKTKAKQKCSPVVAQNLTMKRRSSVWSVLLEKEKIDIIVSWGLPSPMSVDKFFINANFSWSCRVAILITPPPLLPSSPCFFSVKISLRCPSGSCWRNHCKCIIIIIAFGITLG